MSRHRCLPLAAVLQLNRDEVPVDASESYRTAGLRNFGRGVFARPVLDGATSSYSRLYRIHQGQVILSRLFGWEGAVALVPAEFDGWFVSPEFPTFSVDPTAVDQAYLSHVLRSQPFQDCLATSTRGLGQRRQRVHVDDFLAISIPLPTMADQRRLGAHLDRVLDSTIQARGLTDRATILSKALAVASCSRQDQGDEARRAQGWCVTPLAELLVAVHSPVKVELDSSYPIAGIYSFGRGLIDRGPLIGAETSYTSLTLLDLNDVVVSKLNGWEGAVAVVDEGFTGYYVSSEYPTFKANKELMHPEFFKGIARSPWFWAELNAHARGSMVRRRRINAAEFLGTKIWLPPIDVQLQIAANLNVLDRAARVRRAVQNRIDALVSAAFNKVCSPLN